jgi:glucan phosphoethanolaminetransferase (alkaline phosphatase superfamily)
LLNRYPFTELANGVLMAQLAGMKDSWHVLAVKPKYHLYVVVIGESARRDGLSVRPRDFCVEPLAAT